MVDDSALTDSTLTVSVDDYSKIVGLLFAKDGSFTKGITSIDSPHGCFGPLVIGGDSETINTLRELLD